MEKLDTLNLPETIRRELNGRFLDKQPGSLAETCAQVEESLVSSMTAAVMDVLALEAGARGLTFKGVGLNLNRIIRDLFAFYERKRGK